MYHLGHTKVLFFEFCNLHKGHVKSFHEKIIEKENAIYGDLWG